jgi:REP element-mobilizing transposase RayT
MPNTYTKIYIHAVFAVQNRAMLIRDDWKNELFAYMGGIIKTNGHKPLAINGIPDHIHAFIGMKPVQSLSDLMQDIKASSSKWINDHHLVKGHFNWQDGFGAFSYAHSQIDTVIKYINNQQTHHKKKTFKVEYLDMLKKFDVEYNEKYLFKFINDE